MSDDIQNGINLHQTVQPKDWLLSKLREFGWAENPQFMKYFNGHYLRWQGLGEAPSFEVAWTQD